MSSYYKCTFFEEKLPSNLHEFLVSQEEIILDNVLDNNKISFLKKVVNYKCSFFKQENFDLYKPTLLIPIKDNLILLKYTIKNLQETNTIKYCNIIIIDDRSEENIKKITLENNLSYLRVDNDKGFNFSMLNNIAAKICLDLGVEEIILWNSDLWCVKEEFLLEVLRRHRNNKSVVSGTKLVYPSLEMSLNKDLDSDNIKSTFPNLVGGKWRGTTQFGGDCWILTPQSPIKISPLHFKRFADKTNPLVNCDKGVSFVTGAFQIWNLKYFIELGGLNPSLSKNFQDVDICLRVLEDKQNIFYFGKNLYFYHDESFSMHNLKNEKKNDKQMISDHYLFAKIWNDKIIEMVF